MPVPAALYYPVGLVSSLPGILAVGFSDTVSLGTIVLGILLSVATLIGVIYGVKWKVAYEVEVKTREAAVSFGQIKDDESKALHGQLMEAKDVIGDQKMVIERLEALPNLERIIHLMGEQSVRADAAASTRLQGALEAVREGFTEVINAHDHAAEGRTEKVIEAIHELREGRQT